MVVMNIKDRIEKVKAGMIQSTDDFEFEIRDAFSIKGRGKKSRKEDLKAGDKIVRKL